MEKNECYNFFISKGNSGIKPIEKNIRKNFPDLYEAMFFYIKSNENWLSGLTFTCKFYCFLNDIKSIPLCEECSEPVRFKQFSFGFFKFCSRKCSSVNKETRKKCENTCLSKYGHENIAHGSIREKIDLTFKQKYGSHPSRNRDVKDRKNKTFSERYGGHPFSNEKIKEKIKEKWIEKYGADNPLKNEEIKNKMMLTKYERGVLVDYSKNPEILEDFNNYKAIVKRFTEYNFRKYYYEINPDKKRRSKNKWHLDHIYPIIEGWKNKIDPILIANKKNLQMLWCRDNHSKCGHTDMLPEDFFKMLGLE